MLWHSDICQAFESTAEVEQCEAEHSVVDKDGKGMVCTRTRLGTRPLHVMCMVLVLRLK